MGLQSRVLASETHHVRSTRSPRIRSSPQHPATAPLDAPEDSHLALVARHAAGVGLEPRRVAGAAGARGAARRARVSRGLASNIESLVARAELPYTLTSTAPIRRRALLEARADVLALAERLRMVADPRPQGIALAADLLTDSAGPLYNHDADERVEDAARRASDALERPVPPVARR